jgi:biopolymer transport protein ExbD
MRSFRRSFGHAPHGAELGFELNLASIIDCLTVLIAFVLVSASFASVGILDATVAAGGAETTASPSPIDVVIDLKQDRSIFVVLSGGVQKVHRILPAPRQPGRWNYNALSDRLAIIKGEWPKLAAVTLQADDGVDYRDVVKTMEISRLAVPTVNLGGY